MQNVPRGTLHDPPPGGEAVDGAYASPDGFMDDMRLVWANCALYNGKESDVGRLGARVEALFERAASFRGINFCTDKCTPHAETWESRM